MFGPTETPHFVIIETLSEKDIDRDVIPSAIEFVLNNSLPKKVKGDRLSSTVCLLTIDRPVRHFDRLRKRAGISSTHILDGYTDWFGEWMPTKSVVSESGEQKSWHFAKRASPEEIARSVNEAVRSVLSESKRPKDNGEVIAIDSISSILELSPSLDIVLHLLDSIATHAPGESHSGPPPTLIATIRRNQLDPSLCEGLLKLAHTHVLISQTSLNQSTTASPLAGIDRDYVRINLRKRKTSGRLHFEEHITKMDWSNTRLIATDDLKIVGSQLADVAINKAKGTESLELAQHGLSFRVTLSAKEREVRAAAGLPYLHKDEELANSALAFHPENLRLQKENVDDVDEDSSASSGTASEEEELFSEDV